MSEWIEWNGGEMPVPIGTKIIVKYRCGDEYLGLAGTGNAKRWIHLGLSGDIFAYKILEPITPELYGAIPDPKGHPNASILMEIAKEAAINEEYWKEYEVKFYDEEMTIEWIVCRNESDLFYGLQNDINIRRKPRTIRIGNYDVPEPMRDYPENNSAYFLVDILSMRVFDYKWDGQKCEKQWINNSLIHKTKEGAELMLKALQELLWAKQ